MEDFDYEFPEDSANYSDEAFEQSPDPKKAKPVETESAPAKQAPSQPNESEAFVELSMMESFSKDGLSPDKQKESITSNTKTGPGTLIESAHAGQLPSMPKPTAGRPQDSIIQTQDQGSLPQDRQLQESIEDKYSVEDEEVGYDGFVEEEMPEETITDQMVSLDKSPIATANKPLVKKESVEQIEEEKAGSVFAAKKGSNRDEKGKTNIGVFVDPPSTSLKSQVQSERKESTGKEESASAEYAVSQAASSSMAERQDMKPIVRKASTSSDALGTSIKDAVVPDKSSNIPDQVEEDEEEDYDQADLEFEEEVSDTGKQGGTNDFFSPPIKSTALANPKTVTSHSAMHTNAVVKTGPKAVGIKSQLNQLQVDSLSSNEKDPIATKKKFSLVPFAKEKSKQSSSIQSNNESADKQTSFNRNDPMELIQETPEEGKDGTGKKLDFGPTPEPASKVVTQGKQQDEDDDDDDDYEDDNDFEPFETSKKDFYQGESLESKTQRTESDGNRSQNNAAQNINPSQPTNSAQGIGNHLQQLNQMQKPTSVVVVDQQQPIVQQPAQPENGTPASQQSKLKQPTKVTPLSRRSRSPRAQSSLPSDRWINIPALETKFRFRLPMNCHVSKSITAAINHASKIIQTASKRKADGDVSIEFGLHMNDGPIQDSLSAHDYSMHNSPSQARLAHRHDHCKTSENELDHFEWKALNLPEDWRPHAQMIYQVIMLREGQRIMHEAFQVVAAEKVKKDALNQSITQRQSVMALVQSKRHSSVVNQSRRSVISQSSHGRPNEMAFKSKQEEKLSKLEAKYAKLVARQEQLQNPFYFQELRQALKQDEKDLAEAKKFNKQLRVDNSAIETQMVRMQKQVAKNHSGGSNTDVGSKEMSSMMTNLDAANQQLFSLRDKLEKARAQAVNNDEKLSELKDKSEKLILVGKNYQVDMSKLKEYTMASKVTKAVPDKAQQEAEGKLAKAQERRAQAEFKKEQGQAKYEELLAKKQHLLDLMKQKKESLHQLVSDSKDLQNKALKMTKAIRADRDAYLKLGQLQTATNKGQVSLKGWQPENMNSLSYSQQKARQLKRNAESSMYKSIDSSLKVASQKDLSVSGSAAELKTPFTSKPQVIPKGSTPTQPVDLSPLTSSLGVHNKKPTNSQQKPGTSQLKPELVEDTKSANEDIYSLPEDRGSQGTPKSNANRKSALQQSALIESVQIPPKSPQKNNDLADVTDYKPATNEASQALPVASAGNSDEKVSNSNNQTKAPPIQVKNEDISEDEKYSDDEFADSTGHPTPLGKPKAEATLPAHVVVASKPQTASSAVTGVTQQAANTKPSIIGSKPSILGSKPNFMAKKRKF